MFAFLYLKNFSGYFQWKTCVHVQKIFDRTKQKYCKWLKIQKFICLCSYAFVLELYPQKL